SVRPIQAVMSGASLMDLSSHLSPVGEVRVGGNGPEDLREQRMARVLMFEGSYRRMKDRIEALGVAFDPLLIAEDGTISRTGAPVWPDDANADAAWANEEVFRSPAAREFMVAVLKAPHLKWVQSAAAGFDHPVFGQIVQKGAQLSTSHGQALG